MLTNTELAVIGLLSERPKHGYQIEQEIEARGMRDWTEIGFSSIYYLLNKMEAAGWLQSSLQADSGGPARKVYQLTEPGWVALHAAVQTRLANPRPRSADFDLALANLPSLQPQEVQAALNAYRSTLLQRRQHVKSKWHTDRAEAASQGRPFPAHVDALFDRSLAIIHAELQWVERFLAIHSPDHN